MKIYLISLEDAAARRAQIKQCFARRFDEFEVVPAVRGASLLAGKYFSVIHGYFARTRELLTPSEAGCSLSHVEALKRFLQTSHSHALILEDDIIGCDTDLDRIQTIANTLTREFVLGCGGQDGLRSRRWLTGIPRFVGHEKLFTLHSASHRQFWRTCCYVVSRGAAEALLSQHQPIWRADDWHHLLLNFRGDTLYVDILRHPIESHDSVIEIERRQLDGLHRSFVLRLLKKLNLYWSLLRLCSARFVGYRPVFDEGLWPRSR